MGRFGLTDEQVHVVWHEDISNEQEIEMAAHFFEHLNEKVFGADRIEITAAMVAGEGDEMKIALAVEAFQSGGQKQEKKEKNVPPLQEAKPQG